MNKVSNVLTRKNRASISVNPGCSVLDALKIMSDENIGSLVVRK